MAAEELVQPVDEEMSTPEQVDDEVAADVAGAVEQDASSSNIERVINDNAVWHDQVPAELRCQQSLHLHVKHGERGSFAWTCTPKDGKGCGKHYDSAHINAVSFTSLRRYPAGALGHDISETEVVQQPERVVVQPPSGIDPLAATSSLLTSLASQSAEPIVQTLVTLVMQFIKIMQTQQEGMRAQQKAFLAVHEQRQRRQFQRWFYSMTMTTPARPRSSRPQSNPRRPRHAIAELRSTDMKRRSDCTTGQLEAVAVRGIGRHSFQITRNSLHQQGVAVEHIIDRDCVGASTMECVVRAEQADDIVAAVKAISDGSSQHPFRAERGFDASLPPERQGGASAPSSAFSPQNASPHALLNSSRVSRGLAHFTRFIVVALGQQTVLAAQLKAEQVASAVILQLNDSDIMIAEPFPTSTSTAASSSAAAAPSPAAPADAATDTAPTSSTLPLDGR
ncbi:hypothetical protein RI367_002906 [Sorochytrium milnesiophthora]